MFFLFNFTRTLWFFWNLGLTLFDIPKDLVFVNILVFSNIFGFPAVHWTPKWNKTVKLWCLPFKLKFKICRIFQALCLSYWRLTLVKISTRLNNIWESKCRKTTKGGHFMDVESMQKTLKTFNFTTTNAILMKLAADLYLNKVFHLERSWGITHKVQEGINKKTHIIIQKDLGSNFDQSQYLKWQFLLVRKHLKI